MIKKKLLASLVLVISVGACNPQQMLAGYAVNATRSDLSPQTVSVLTSICRNGSALVEQVAVYPGVPGTAKDIAVFVGAYCNQLLAGGGVPATTDGNTINWLNQNIATLQGLIGKVKI